MGIKHGSTGDVAADVVNWIKAGSGMEGAS